MKLTVVVLTYNEADFIAGCLQTLHGLTDDIVVLDACSTDATPRIASQFGARVVPRTWQGFAAARNAALDLARESDWLLFVDADERVPPGLASELLDTVNNAPSEVDGYLLPRRNVICGRIMRGGGWWPDYQLRLLRPARSRYREGDTVHETAACCGPTLALNTPLLHLNYRTWVEFTRKQIAYAGLAGKAGDHARARALVGAPLRTFWRRFVTDEGYRDGLHGLVAATILAGCELYRVRVARRAR